MNDIDFAFSISQKIGSLYKDAQENCAELPDYSLGKLRGLCYLVCDLIAQSQNPPVFDGSDLDNKIARLLKSRLIDKQTSVKLNQLRQNGNIGAHPEKHF